METSPVLRGRVVAAAARKTERPKQGSERVVLTEYDPDQAPDAERWLAQDEMSLVGLVQRYHREHRIVLPEPRVHAALHVMVENQAALGERTPVREAVARLMGEGMSRHDAVHAVGAILSRHMHQARDAGVPVSRERYFDDVRAVTLDRWLAEYGPGPDD